MASTLCWKVQQRTCVALYPRGKKNSGWVRFFPGEGKRTVKKKQSAWEQTFVEWTHQQGKQPQQDTSNSEPNPIELILLGPIMWAQLHALLWTLLQSPWFSKSCFLDSAFLRWCVMHGKMQSIPLGLMKHVWKRSQKQISICAPCHSSFSSAYHDERGVCRGPCVWTAKQNRINIWQCSMRCFIHVWQVSI